MTQDCTRILYNVKGLDTVNVCSRDLHTTFIHGVGYNSIMNRMATMTDRPNTVARIKASNLKALREMAGIKQGEFAKLIGLSKQRLYYYENDYKGDALPVDLASQVQSVLERRGMDLRTIAAVQPLRAEAPGSRALIKENSAEEKLDMILQTLVEIKEILSDSR